MTENHGTPRHNIFINDNRYTITEDSQTGAQLKGLDGIPAANTLFLEVPGPDPDKKIDDAETVTLKSGMRFYDLPPIGRGALEMELERLRTWYPGVTTERVPEGVWVSVEVLPPKGWVGDAPRIGVLTTETFPEQKPDGFWITVPMTTPGGTEITGPGREQGGRSWKKWCWQVQAWDAARERLWRYFKAMERWFVEGGA